MSYGYLVVYGSGEEYCSDAASALRFKAFMECMGYDPVVYLAYMVNGKVEPLERMTEQEVRSAMR